MKTSQLTVLAAAALLALTLAGCAPTTTDTPTDTGSDTGSSEGDTTDTSDDSSDFAGVTLPGTGDYAVPADAPIGGFELPDDMTQPDGCTWQIYQDDTVLAEDQGTFVFLTDVTTRFVTDGCPDWVQFE